MVITGDTQMKIATRVLFMPTNLIACQKVEFIRGNKYEFFFANFWFKFIGFLG
jgi:hypothetical protein